MWLTVSTLSNILILKGQYLHTTLNAFSLPPHFALYFEHMIKKEQDNGCNRSSKKVEMLRFNYVLKENMTRTHPSSFTSTSFGFFGRRQQRDLKELYHPSRSLPRDPLLS